MKAWEVRQGQLGIHDVPVPQAHAGQAVVRVSYAGICGSDLPKLLRPKDFSLPEPWRPGHEIVGVNASGRPAAVDPLIPCRCCPSCILGDTHLCPGLRRVGWDVPGGFAEHVVLPEQNLRPLPPGLTSHHAVLADPAAVAIHGLRCNDAALAASQLAVIGVGAVGTLTALYATQQGSKVTVVHRDGRPPPRRISDVVPADFRAASSLGIADKFAVVVDAASGESADPLALGLRIVRDGGTVIVQNAYHPGVTLKTPLREIFRRSVRLIGSFSYCRRQPQDDDFGQALTLLQGHTEQLSRLVAEPIAMLDLRRNLAGGSKRVARHVMFVEPPSA